VYIPTNCAAKNGTYATLQMLQSQEVDVIFGPICGRGKLPVHSDYNYKDITNYNKTRDINMIFVEALLRRRSRQRDSLWVLVLSICPSVRLSVCLSPRKKRDFLNKLAIRSYDTQQHTWNSMTVR